MGDLDEQVHIKVCTARNHIEGNKGDGNCCLIAAG